MVIEPRKINPVGKRVIIEEILSTVESPLELSDSAAPSTPVMGTVIKAGQESLYEEGQIVFFRRYSVDELKIFTDDGEQKIHLLEDEEIIATYPKEETPPEPRAKTQREEKIERNLSDRNSNHDGKSTHEREAR